MDSVSGITKGDSYQTKAGVAEITGFTQIGSTLMVQVFLEWVGRKTIFYPIEILKLEKDGDWAKIKPAATA